MVLEANSVLACLQICIVRPAMMMGLFNIAITTPDFQNS